MADELEKSVDEIIKENNLDLKYAKENNKNPQEFANALREALNGCGEFEKVEAVSGFVNITLSDDVVDLIAELATDDVNEKYDKLVKLRL